MPGHRHRAPLVKRSIIPIVFRGNALNDWNDCTIPIEEALPDMPRKH